MSTSAPHFQLQVATLRVGQELELLEHRIERLEHALERHMCSEDVAHDGNAIRAIQEIDMVRQTIKTLATFLISISQHSANSEAINVEDAIERVPLRDVASRLRTPAGITATLSLTVVV